MRTNIVIDDDLMMRAMKITGLDTKKKTVEDALRLMISVYSQSGIRKFRGTLDWQGDLDSMRRD